MYLDKCLVLALVYHNSPILTFVVKPPDRTIPSDNRQWFGLPRDFAECWNTSMKKHWGFCRTLPIAFSPSSTSLKNRSAFSSTSYPRRSVCTPISNACLLVLHLEVEPCIPPFLLSSCDSIAPADSFDSAISSLFLNITEAQRKYFSFSRKKSFRKAAKDRRSNLNENCLTGW